MILGGMTLGGIRGTVPGIIFGLPGAPGGPQVLGDPGMFRYIRDLLTTEYVDIGQAEVHIVLQEDITEVAAAIRGLTAPVV